MCVFFKKMLAAPDSLCSVFIVSDDIIYFSNAKMMCERVAVFLSPRELFFAFPYSKLYMHTSYIMRKKTLKRF